MIHFFSLLISLSFLGCVLGVSRPPTLLSQPPKEATFILKEATVLECLADADPTPNYKWFKNGISFNTAANSGRYTVWPGKGTLIFVNPHRDDDGLYQCVAENQFGKSLSVKTNLRRAEFSSFDGRPQERFVKRGASTTLMCNKPTSYPPPVISWFSKTAAGVENKVIEDSRHSINIFGDLVFASVQPEDDNVQYFCVASSAKLNRNERGFPYTIKVQNMNVNPDHKVEMAAKTPTLRTGYINKSIEFICIFRGNPVPAINWEFIDNTNTKIQISKLPHVRIAQSGVKLIIDRIMQVHEGAYRCIGTNRASIEQNSESKLTVKSYPYWKVKPQNTMKPPGDSHTFECSTGGNPKPNIEWSVNGVRASQWIMQQPDRRKLVGNTKLVITDLKKIDTAVIQCNASNDFGYVFADAYINVVQEPPTFIHKMEVKTYKAEGQSVTLNCSTYSAPAAIPTWTRVERNQQLTGGRYNILENGNLLIKSLMVSDSGDYKCIARNLYGSVVTQGRLIVRRRTRITLPPKDVRVYERTDVKFLCAGSTDPLEVQKLRQSWMRDGVTIDLTKQTRVRVNEADNSLIIGGVRPMDTGSYKCTIENGIDSASASATLIVQGRPDQPNSVTVDCITKKSERKAIVNWKAGADNSAPILKYLVEVAIHTHPNTWYPAEIEKSEAVGGSAASGTEEGGANPSAEVIMRPGLRYSFRVRSRNIVGLSEPSISSTTTCTTDNAVPSTNPTNLWAEGTQQNNIIVHWTPMSEFEKNANGLQYRLTIACENCVNMPKDAVNTTLITDWRDTNVPFINNIKVDTNNYLVERYKKYKVTIRAVNVIGDSSQSAVETTGYSGEGPPSTKVADVGLVPNSQKNVGQENQLTLQWTPPADVNDTAAINGFFRGYRVEWCHDGLDATQCEATKRYEDDILFQPKHPLFMKYRRRRRDTEEAEELLDRQRRATTKRTFTVTRLPGKSKLKVWVRVLNKRYAGPISNIITVNTAEGTPGPVVNFKLSRKGVTHLSFIWNTPSQTNGNLTGYQMGVQMIDGLDLGYLKRYPEITDMSALTGEVAGLKPNSLYRVFIWPRTIAGYGVSSFVDVKTSPANVAPGSPTIRIDSVGVSTINVSFAPSQIGEPGSVFYVQFRLPGRNKWEESQREFSRRWLYLTDLPTDTNYEVRVVATNGAGLTSFSETVFVATGGAGPRRLAGASATWFIIIICLLLLLIGGIIGLFYLRRRRLEAIQGKPVPTEDPDKHRYGSAPAAIPSAEVPTKSQPLEPEHPEKPGVLSNIGQVDYSNVPYPNDDQASWAPSSQPSGPPTYHDAQRAEYPDHEDEWRPPMPGRQRMFRPARDDYSASGAPGMGSPAPSSTGASVNPNPTII